MTSSSMAVRVSTWRTPIIILSLGCLITVIAFGARSTLGFFLTPMSEANHWGRDVFAFAIALQNVLWGAGQPISGMVADRFGTVRVLWVGALLYAAGLALMAYSTSGWMLDLSAGVLLGFVQGVQKRLGAGFHRVRADALAVVPAAFDGDFHRDFGEGVFASPAISNGQLFIRADNHLYCIGGKTTVTQR